MSEDQLISGLIEKDAYLQRFLHKKWYGYLYKIAYNILRNPQDVEDVLQESFLKIYNNINKFTPGNSFKAWMAVIVKNRALTHLATNKKYRECDDLDGYEPLQKKSQNFVDAIMAGDSFRKALSLLHQRSPNQYMYMRLHFEEGMSTKEISEDIDVPEGTVKSQVSRGRQSMKEYLVELDR
jgi:RNA polymerase sigma-70 factor (ECF subfamily)